MNAKLKSMAKNIKAMFFDIDGTLFSNKTYKVPGSALEALDIARRNGIMLFLATGRHKSQAEDVRDLSGVPFTGWVTMNGQYCHEGGNVVYKRAIDPSDVRRMADYVRETSTPCVFLEADCMYVNFVNEYVRKEHAAVLSAVPEARDISRVFEREILQMGMYLPDKGIPEILESLPHCTYTRWHTNGVDILPKGGGKWSGIEQMMKYFGLSREEVMSFGDNDNDLDMLAHSGISVAMGNAGDNIKAVADYVTDDVDEDGIYNAIREFFSREAAYN